MSQHMPLTKLHNHNETFSIFFLPLFSIQKNLYFLQNRKILQLKIKDGFEKFLADLPTVTINH